MSVKLEKSVLVQIPTRLHPSDQGSDGALRKARRCIPCESSGSKRFSSDYNPLFILVICFLITISSICDRVAANTAINGVYDRTEKVDVTNILREIYLDDSHQVIKIIIPPTGGQVQKFHPNGRYGRRSVEEGTENPASHIELGKLEYEDTVMPLRSILRGMVGKLRPTPFRAKSYARTGSESSNSYDDNGQEDIPMTRPSVEQEFRKLLACSYAGHSNYYRCRTTNRFP